MPLKIVRNDITKMNTEAIVNTANDLPTVGTGCDSAIYKAAGYELLLAYRTEKVGAMPEGSAFITPGFNLPAKFIIHAVSPRYIDGESGEEDKLRSCYRESLRIAKENRLKSIAFPLIATGGFGYPKAEGLRIAADEINSFLLANDMLVYIVVFDDKVTGLGSKLYPNLEEYIDNNYVKTAELEEYGSSRFIRNQQRETVIKTDILEAARPMMMPAAPSPQPEKKKTFLGSVFKKSEKAGAKENKSNYTYVEEKCSLSEDFAPAEDAFQNTGALLFEEVHEDKLNERMKHVSDTFSEYLMYLIQEKGMDNARVWKNALVDKKVFSKIKNNPDYHPNKKTALCLCVGAELNMDQARDLLARAGYALSPCDKTDIIFSYFIENNIYDMVELDIQLEEHGLPCIIA